MPRFAKGTPKPPGSGRKKGQTNRNTQFIASRLAELGCDPLEGMALIAADPETPRELKFRCYAELAQYKHAKRRSIELSGIGGGPIDITVSAKTALRDRIAGIATRVGSPVGIPDGSGSASDPLRLASTRTS